MPTVRDTTPQYREGDLVWLDTRNLFTKQPCQKLENRRAESYPVKQIVSTHAIELELSEDICVHPVFHVNLLESAATDSPHAGHIQPLPLPIKLHGENATNITNAVDLLNDFYTRYPRKPGPGAHGLTGARRG